MESFSSWGAQISLRVQGNATTIDSSNDATDPLPSIKPPAR
jgi:hypothetical protein